MPLYAAYAAAVAAVAAMPYGAIPAPSRCWSYPGPGAVRGAGAAGHHRVWLEYHAYVSLAGR
jgi:hypothetical protein